MKKAVVAIGLVAVCASCVRIPPRRVLPMEISRIYIPMVENKSYEPGVEEKLTRALQEEFLVDGRLDVVRPQYADAVLKSTLRKFDVLTDRLGYDEFPITSRIIAVADVELYDPKDRKREKPLMTWKNISTEFSYLSDVRYIAEVSPDDALQDALRNLAREIVLTVIATRPEEYEQMRSAAAIRQPAPPKPVLGTEEVNTQLQKKKSKDNEGSLEEENLSPR